MAAIGQTVSVGTSATQLFQVLDAVSYPASPTATQFKAGSANDPLPILLSVPSGGTVYLGGSTVTNSGGASPGCAVAGPATFSYNAIGDDSLYAAASSGTVLVGVCVMRQ